MAYGVRENIGTRFRRASRQAAVIRQAEDAERQAFTQAYVETLTDEELDRLIEDGEAGGGGEFQRMHDLLDTQFAQHLKDKKARKDNGEPEKPAYPPGPPERLW